ncbi:flagellar biosynthesis protein FliQ [Thiorhodospira sibirica]|uniref:flagellar biosynthesis protein FliQ n=1 Tax=Thiorhodospira sibirica TaxID=154347 RepID=UPI00022C525B|nr:flagellar biosynthesis protein FliQ [Thiorhodospira sibirica]
MTPELVVEISRSALWLVILLVMPPLLTALVIGVIIAMLQAATSVQEMTLTFIPKLLGMFFALMLAGHWMLGLLIEYTQELIESIPFVIG